MFRRNSDYLRLMIGFILLVIGVGTYVFPEISYQKSKGSEAVLGSRQYDQGSLVVPDYLSITTAVLGSLIIISTLRYARRSR